jgi:hypothetical protein
LKQGFIKDGYPMDKFVSRFVSGDVDPIFASWGEHVASWIATRLNGREFLLLRYEDMKANPALELAKIADFLQISYDAEKLTRAVELSSVERMRELEKRDEHRWIGTRSRRKDVRFVRTATIGGWRSLLSEEDVAKIEKAWAPVMKNLGYQLSSTQTQQQEPLREILHDSTVRR